MDWQQLIVGAGPGSSGKTATTGTAGNWIFFVLALDEPPLNVLGLPGPHYEVAGDGEKNAKKRVRRGPAAAAR